MKIKVKSFLGRLYRLNYDLAPWHPYGMPNLTNLCHFMRVIFLWLPFKIALAATMIAAGFVWWEIPLIVGIGSLVILSSFFLIFCVIDKLWPRLRKIENMESVSVVAQYLKAKKAKVCPFVEIVED